MYELSFHTEDSTEAKKQQAETGTENREKASFAASVVYPNHSGFLKPEILAKLKILPGRIAVAFSGAETRDTTVRLCRL